MKPAFFIFDEFGARLDKKRVRQNIRNWWLQWRIQREDKGPCPRPYSNPKKVIFMKNGWIFGGNMVCRLKNFFFLNLTPPRPIPGSTIAGEYVEDYFSNQKILIDPICCSRFLYIFEENPVISLWVRLLSDCRQRVLKLSFSTEILCRQSETSRIDATVLQYPYTISFTDCR